MTNHSISSVNPGWQKTEEPVSEEPRAQTLLNICLTPFIHCFFPLRIAAMGCPIRLSPCAKGSSSRCWPLCHCSRRVFVSGSVEHPCAECPDPACCVSAGERDGGERPVRVRVRVGVQWAGVTGSGSTGSAHAGLLPHAEPQLRPSHREGLLPGRRVHIAALLVSPAYHYHGQDHPEQHWWVTQREILRGHKGKVLPVHFHQIKLFSASRQALRRGFFTRELDRLISLKPHSDKGWCSCGSFCVQTNLFSAKST